jgi:hypothetical protein
MEELLREFNEFFEGIARAEIRRDELWITISGATLKVSLPKVVGAQSTALS